MSSRANSFGTFLQTVNIGKEREATQSAAEGAFDVEVCAKRALQFLAERKGQGPSKDLEGALALPAEPARQVLDYLVEAGLVVRSGAGGETIELTSFGRDAMNMFSVS